MNLISIRSNFDFVSKKCQENALNNSRIKEGF